MEKKQLKDMFDNLLHIGNKMNFWNPRMKPYIYGSTNGVHVINLMKTCQKLEEIQKLIEESIKSGKNVMIVCSKLQWRDSWRKVAEATGCPFVADKWVPGLLTNFKTIRKRIGTYVKLLKDAEVGAFNIYTKKEKASKMLELEKLDTAFCGLKEMKKLPDIIFVVDSVYERQAVKEANTLGIDVVAIANTNADDFVLTNLVPANTNSVKSLEYLAKALQPAFSTKRPAEKTPMLTAKPVAAPGGMKVKKMDDTKVSGVKKAPVKKAEENNEKKTPTKK